MTWPLHHCASVSQGVNSHDVSFCQVTFALFWQQRFCILLVQHIISMERHWAWKKSYSKYDGKVTTMSGLTIHTCCWKHTILQIALRKTSMGLTNLAQSRSKMRRWHVLPFELLSPLMYHKSLIVRCQLVNCGEQ